jgi:hypothetical protein
LTSPYAILSSVPAAQGTLRVSSATLTTHSAGARAPNTRCKVCTGRYSDAALLAGCRHARAAASALAADARARRTEHARVLETLLAVGGAGDAGADAGDTGAGGIGADAGEAAGALAAALALARGVHAEYEAVLGAAHLTTAHFKMLLAHVLSRCERDAEAVPLFQACARAQAAMVRSWDAELPSAHDRKWMHRALRTRLNAAVSAIFAAEAAAEGPRGHVFDSEDSDALTRAAGEAAEAREQRQRDAVDATAARRQMLQLVRPGESVLAAIKRLGRADRDAKRPLQAGEEIRHLGLLPARDRSHAHQEHQRRHDRHEHRVEVRRAHRDLAEIEGVEEQRIERAQQDRAGGDHEQQVVQQQGRFARDRIELFGQILAH